MPSEYKGLSNAAFTTLSERIQKRMTQGG